MPHPNRTLPIDTPHPLELDATTMRWMVERAMERAVEHVETLDEQPTHATTGGRRLARTLREAMPETGTPFEDLLRLLFERVIPASLNTASPGYLAYIPGGGLFHAAVADFVTAAVNRYVGVWQAAPGLVQIESNVISWCASIMGMPEGAGGLLTSGGSIANLVAMVAAREDRLRGGDLSRGVAYASEEVHHSVRKALSIAGIRLLRPVPADERFRMRPDALALAIARDRAAGLTPFVVVATAGTTNTGAVDPLPGIADVAAREGVWFHVDAAYGGFFALTERGRAALSGIERADSVTLDPHKSLFLPYGTGCLIARDPSALRRAHSADASYMPPMESEPDLVDFSELGPELSREVRGLRVWLPFRMHGAGAFRAELDEKLDLARDAAAALAALPCMRLVAAPELSLFAFRLEPDGASVESGDDATRRLLSMVNQKKRVFITGAVTKGVFVARVCVLSFRTHRDRMEMLVEDVAEAARAILG